VNDPVVFAAHESYVLGLRFTADGQTLISSGMDNLVKLWSVRGWELVRTFAGHANSVNSLALSPDEKVLATGSSDNTVKLWSFPEGEVLHTLQDRKKTVSAVAISADGRWVAAASYGGRAAVWTLGGQEVVGIKASQANLSSVAFSPDGQVLATAGLGDTISLWSLPSGKLIHTLTGHKTAVGWLRYLDGGRTLVSVGHEGAIKFWDAETGQERRTVYPHNAPAPIRGLALSHDEATAAVGLEERVQIWSVDDWTLRTELPVGTRAVNGMAFSRDGGWLAVGAADQKIRVWALE